MPAHIHRVPPRAVPLLLRILLTVAAAGWLSASRLSAQAGTVAGVVVDGKTGRPVPGVIVTVEGTEASARTDGRGQFRLANLADGPVTLRAVGIGYVPFTRRVETGTENLRLELTESIVKLDEVIVTGTVGEVQQRTLGNAIGKVDVSSTVAVAPPAKLQDILSVNVPGVRIIRSSGAVGSGGLTRIRGSGSLSLTNEPLVYVDGIRVNNANAVASEAFNGYDGPSRINDLVAEEIERIEVLKGPSAATIYGTEASNGVIQIITKRGRPGRPTFDVHTDFGTTWLMNPEGRYSPNYYIGRDGNVHEFDVLDFRKQKGFDPIFTNGALLGSGASLSGGTDQLRYFFSGDVARDEGYVDYNWQNKYSARANLNYSSPGERFEVGVSFGYVRSKLRGATGLQPITTSILWTCIFPGCEPDPADPDNTGFNDEGGGFQFYRPEDYDRVHAFDYVDRLTMSIRLAHRPTSWFRHYLTVGPDFTNNKSSLLVERFPDRDPFFGVGLGLKSGAHNRYTFVTLDYGASADWKINQSLTTTTTAGFQYYSKQLDRFRGEGRQFAIPGPSDITGSAQRQATEFFAENKTVGLYVQEQLAIKNRLFLTAAIRGDDNSAFGENFNAAYYPKFAVSWVASEESFLQNSGWIDQLKLRAAFGRAGQQPDIFSAVQTYQTKVGPGGQPGVTPQNFGNPDLKPEVGQELEAGFDAAFFRQRLGVEFTVYRKDVRDAILTVPIKPSRGFPGSQFVNIGKTRNQGLELGLDGTILQSENVGLDLRFVLGTNNSKILDMGDVPPTFVGGAFIQQWNVEGFAPASFFYKRVLSSTLVDTPFGFKIGSDVMCEGGARFSKGDGTTIPCSQANELYHGRPTPSWSGSFSPTLTLWKRLRLLAVADFLAGGTSVVGDIAAVHAFFWNSKALLDGTDPILGGYIGLFFAGDPNAVGAVGVVKNGFARLRTLAATYELPARITGWVGASRGSVTLSGENLAFLWRDQKGAYGTNWIDPEINPNNSFSSVTGNDGYIQESWPQAARLRMSLRLTF